MRSTILLCTILLLGPLVYGQIDEVRRITKILCSPEFHGRGYVNKGDSLAADFLAKEFEKVGARPVGNSYFQHFNLPVNTFPGNMYVSLGDRSLIPGKHFVVDPGSKGFEGSLKMMEIDARTIMNEGEMMSAMQTILKDRVYDGVTLNLLDASEDTLRELRGVGRELAQYMPVVELVNSKFTWSVSQEQLGNVYLQLQDSVYRGDAVMNLKVDAEFIPVYRSQNVIATIPSKRKCAKTIVFTAHYDHLGRMGTETYFPGANDNASGTAMLLTMAKHFIDNPSKYNIVFIAFAGEEAGLVGSKYYVENPLFKLKKIKFLINLDIMGSGEEGITVVNATLFEDEFKDLQEINEKEQLLTKVKSRGPAQNSDHFWFTEKGVPAFFIYTMGPNKHYHDIFDEYEELSFSEYYDITKLLTQFVGSL